MSLIFSIHNEDIDLFINSYTNNLLDGTVNSHKLPQYVELLKTIKYYRIHQIEFDDTFLKKFDFHEDDYEKILKLLNRVKKGKAMHHRQVNYKVNGCSGTSNSIYSSFNEKEDYTNKPKFELFSQVESAMDDYYNKMNKLKEKRSNEKNNKSNRSFEQFNNTRYYTDSENSERPQIDFNHLTFANSKLCSTDKSNSFKNFDIINNVLDNEQLLTHTFDKEFKHAYPNISNNKKVNHYNNVNYSENNENVIADRYWQDLSLMNTSNTRNKAIKNNQPFENQFQYLDGNYNQVQDERLISASSRLDNRSMNFKR